MKPTERLRMEIRNLERIVEQVLPKNSERPRIKGIDIYGKTIPLRGFGGGDHITFIDFKKRHDLRARIKKAKSKRVKKNLKNLRKKGGILLADVAGHNITDALLASQLHQAFLTGALYELDLFGDITTNLFEHLNTRFYKSSSIQNYITAMYGEISEKGTFRFISAGHPTPILFSNKENKIIEMDESKIKKSLPIGYIPSKHNIDFKKNNNSIGFKEKYEVNELKKLDKGDMYVLFTDGLSEHFEDSFQSNLEETLRMSKNLSTAKGVFNRVEKKIYDFGKPKDDISYVIIKKK